MTVTPPGGPGASLRDRVGSLLADAGEVYAATPWAPRLRAAARRLDGPLRVAVAGRVKAGKSTLLNALVGRVVAATDAGECTRIVTWYGWGETVAARAVPVSGSPFEVPVRSDPAGALVLDLPPGASESWARLEIDVPSPALRHLVLVDTPGIASLSPQLGARTRDLLAPDDAAADTPDAVVYLMRQLHVSDVDFLEAFRDPLGRAVPPVNAVAVLSHADEIGGGRPDALAIARGLADGYAADPRLRPVVQTVVAVAGLLAEAAATLTDAEHAALAELAAVPAPVTDPLLLSATRFGAPRRYLPVRPDVRRALLARLGLFGVRWALGLARAGNAGTPAELRAALAATSGAGVLHDVLTSQITGRRDVLKADAALHLVQRAVVADPVPGARRLSAMAERIRIGVHDFEEVRLLNELRLGAVDVEDAERVRMERLLGARGGGVRERLGIGSAATDLTAAVMAEHAHWQQVAADVLAAPEVARAAAVLQRTCVELHTRARRTPQPAVTTVP